MSNHLHSPKIHKTSEKLRHNLSEAKQSPSPLQRNVISRKDLSPSNIMQLQRTIGNQAVQRLIAEQTSNSAENATSTLQRVGVEEEELQMKAVNLAPIQRKSSSNKLPAEVQGKMEKSMGADFLDVTIHEVSKASDVGALAYAQGNDLHFAQGQ